MPHLENSISRTIRGSESAYVYITIADEPRLFVVLQPHQQPQPCVTYLPKVVNPVPETFEVEVLEGHYSGHALAFVPESMVNCCGTRVTLAERLRMCVLEPGRARAPQSAGPYPPSGSCACAPGPARTVIPVLSSDTYDSVPATIL